MWLSVYDIVQKYKFDDKYTLSVCAIAIVRVTHALHCIKLNRRNIHKVHVCGMQYM